MKKNMFNSIVFIMSLFGLGMNIASAGPMVEFESGFEEASLYIRLANDLTGIIKGRECDSCEMKMVTITPNTKLEINGLMVDLIRARSLSGKEALVIYNIKTKEVRLISH